MKAWENFLTLQEIELGIETVRKWLRTLKVIRFDACNLYLEAKDSFQALWFEEHIRPKVKTRLFNNNNKQIRVHLNVSNVPQKKESYLKQKAKTELSAQPFKMTFDAIDPNCRFNELLAMDNNNLPVKVLAEICNCDLSGSPLLQPASEPAFNPTYIFGDNGSGKTHLLMAASHAMRAQGKNVIYTKAETFTEHVVTAIRAGEMSTFRQAYRNVDALIIDDVHIFSRKGATQEELFHTFNTLHLSCKPIILSANCSPNDLHHIEPRLISRFEWGIALEIQSYKKPQILMIIEKKAKSLNFNLRPAIADFLVDTFPKTTTAIRALEALILRCHMNHHQKARFSSTTLTVAYVKNMLKDLIEEEEQKALTPQKIIKSVAEHQGIKVEDILGKSQARECALPRKLAMYLIRDQLQMPFIAIGDIFMRDHSTVISSIKGIKKLIDSSDEEIQSTLRLISKTLKNTP